MRKSVLFLLLLLISCPNYVKGQGAPFHLINLNESPFVAIDSAAIYDLLEKGRKIQKLQPELALRYYRSALEKCTSGPLAPHKARVFIYIASYYMQRKDYYAAIGFTQKAIEISLRQRQHPFKYYFSLGSLYLCVGGYDQVIALYKKASSAAPLNATDSHFLYRMTCDAAQAYWEKGMTDTASKLYYQVIETAAHTDTNRIALMAAYTGIANILMRLSQWDKAGAFMAKAADMAIATGDSLQIINVIANKGTIYYEQKDYSKAKECHYIALAYARRKKEPDLIYSSAYIIGAILSKEGKYTDAQIYAKEAYDQSLVSASTPKWLSASYLMGCTYTHTGQYSIAKKYLIPAVKYAEEYHNIATLEGGYDHLSSIYAGLGQYKEALRYKEKQFRLRDTMAGKENAGRIAEIEMKYNTEKKDKLIVQKELLLSQQQVRLREKNIWISGLGTSGLLLAIILISLNTRKRQKEKLHKASILNMEKDREIIALKAKMEGEEEERARLARDLHDGVVVKFSAVKMNLSVLPDRHNSLEGAKDFLKVISRLDEATTELRATAHNLLPDTLLEGGLSEALYYFCKNIEQNSGLDIDLQCSDIPRFEAGFELSVYRIAQELVQNVLKHAAATNALVQLSYTGNLLNITVEDNGKGFPLVNKTGSGGIGLKNMKARVASLKGDLDIRSSPGKGTSIYIELIPILITK